MRADFTEEMINRCKELRKDRAAYLMSPAEKREGSFNWQRRLRDLTQKQLADILLDGPEDAYRLLDWADQELIDEDQKAHVWGWESNQQQVDRLTELVKSLREGKEGI